MLDFLVMTNHYLWIIINEFFKTNLILALQPRSDVSLVELFLPSLRLRMYINHFRLKKFLIVRRSYNETHFNSSHHFKETLEKILTTAVTSQHNIYQKDFFSILLKNYIIHLFFTPCAFLHSTYTTHIYLSVTYEIWRVCNCNADLKLKHQTYTHIYILLCAKKGFFE